MKYVYSVSCVIQFTVDVVTRAGVEPAFRRSKRRVLPLDDPVIKRLPVGHSGAFVYLSAPRMITVRQVCWTNMFFIFIV